MKKTLLLFLSVCCIFGCTACFPVQKTPSAEESAYSEPASKAIATVDSSAEASSLAPESSDVLPSEEPSEEPSVPEPSEEESSAEPVSESGTEGGKVSYDNIDYAFDITPYLQYIEPDNTEDYTILVNYDHRLNASYAPSDLRDSDNTRADRDKQKLRLAACMALEAFLKEGAAYGVTDVTVTSAYRSYATQEYLFNYYVEKYQPNYATREECEEYVKTFSCMAGCSEHQTGLCCDMHNLGAADESFGNTASAKWLAANAYRFGFILRFPADKTESTGISYEPWHFRFVGRTVATYIYKNNLSLEEYWAMDPAADNA